MNTMVTISEGAEIDILVGHDGDGHLTITDAASSVSIGAVDPRTYHQLATAFAELHARAEAHARIKREVEATLAAQGVVA